MYNDETGEEPTIIRASFADPYLWLIRTDGSVMLHVCDGQTLEMEEVTLRSDLLKVRIWGGIWIKVKANCGLY